MWQWNENASRCRARAPWSSLPLPQVPTFSPPPSPGSIPTLLPDTSLSAPRRPRDRSTAPQSAESASPHLLTCCLRPGTRKPRPAFSPSPVAGVNYRDVTEIAVPLPYQQSLFQVIIYLFTFIAKTTVSNRQNIDILVSLCNQCIISSTKFEKNTYEKKT